jgi:hypothetical protein
MSSFLSYSYSICLTENEKTEIDKEVKKNRAEFCRGFIKGTQISLLIYSVYSLTKAAASADPGPKGPPADTGPVQGVPASKPGAIQGAPARKPGVKPLSEGTKGAYVGGASAVCGAALQSKDFYLGLACAVLLVIGGIVINRH